MQFLQLEKLAQWLCLVPAVGLSSLCPPASHSQKDTFLILA